MVEARVAGKHYNVLVRLKCGSILPRRMTTSDEKTELLSDLGHAVRTRREASGFSRRELSERTGVSVRFIAELEAGRGNISVARLHDVAVALGTSASALLDREARRAAKAPSSIALLGLRGAGKSTVGARLARRLRVPFVELDQKVEEAAGVSLREIFELHGEAFYRRTEREVLRRCLDASPVVLATGGSIVNDEESFALLRARATTVWLQAAPESHWERVVAQGDRRPMQDRADAMTELRSILRQRTDRYARAEIAVDTDALGVEGTVAEIVRRVPPLRPMPT
jgi:XRE family transcriptional regulator, aerobic/anaerobic benzoate catabolism transcriptional regulator